MNEVLKTWRPMTLPGMDDATFSPGSAAGTTPSSSPAGRTGSKSGRAPAHVNRSAPPESTEARPTIATCGPSGLSSSLNDALHSCLASRLPTPFGTAGSTIYAQTWKEKATPSGGGTGRTMLISQYQLDADSKGRFNPKPPILLNPQQSQALDDMLRFLDSDDSFFLLSGYAGTGKTTTIQTVIERMIITMDINVNDIALSAPTNKAVKVLKRMNDWQCYCGTIHHLLGLSVNEAEGESSLKSRLSEFDVPKIAEFKIVVIDECSMIDQSLFKTIIEKAIEYDLKIILMGDPAQLPPVNERVSYTFVMNCPKAHLTQVMRQAAENPVLDVCTRIRQAISRETDKPGSNNLAIGSEASADGRMSVTVLTGVDASLFDDWINDAFQGSPMTAKTADAVRVIAWTNNVVTAANNRIHRLLFPESHWMAPGEIAVAYKPVKTEMLVTPTKKREILFGMSTEFEILHITLETNDWFPELSGHSYRVSIIDIDSEKARSIWALDYEGLSKRDAMLRAMINSINSVGRGTQRAKQLWGKYYTLHNAFADIRHAYCLTSHKSQGSTFANVFVDGQDIVKNPRRLEALQCFYTACSRSQQNLVIKL